MSLLKFYNITNCEWEVDFKNETWSNILLLTRNFYGCSDPLFTAVIASLFITLLVWLLSVITRNYSQVDRLWTILPVIYTWHFVLYDCFKDLSTCNLRFLNVRGIIMGILATMWGVRLSYNFMRKGGYNWNGEDYSSSKTIPIISESNYSIGFLCNGLFRYSRHPNYFCEIGLWWIFYIFSIAAGGNEWILNWSIIGALNLTILMYSSTIFTESISRKKYPMYKEYQKTTSMIIPWFSGPELIKKTT
ncbi:28443_t:CDS:2 [Gigaspora margarita]|uniref:28443_t:CDS:1 n=1 Tax=Gigaspora margarita TaxID=4874 RepID=A0ABN7V7V8_GIGMA|nr:28443_t:CDS:2 [Gigaspora margarita]